MSTVPVTVRRIQVGEIPGPVSITCMEGETVWSIYFRNDDTLEEQNLQLCVPNAISPCDTGGVWDLMAAAGWLPDPDPCA